MNQQCVKSLADCYRRILSEIQHSLVAIQAECTHPAATRKAGSNTGNYDPSCDHYWYDYDCPDCGKRWTTPQ